MKKWYLLICLLLALSLSGCGGSPLDTVSEDGGTSDVSSAPLTVAVTEEEMFTDRDYEVGYDETAGVLISLQGNSVSCEDDSVKINGTTVTLTGEKTYIFSGTLSNGQIVVEGKDTEKPHLIFNGVSVTSRESAALYIKEAEKVFVTLAADTQNTLANSGNFVADGDTNIDGAMFSKQDLTVNGSGSLTVTSPAGHGVVCKDDLVFTGGTVTVQAASHGLQANDSVRLTQTTLSLDAGKDGIHAENDEDATKGFVYIGGGKITANAQGDGISAGTDLTATGGVVVITAGGGSENATKQQSDYYGGFMGGRPGQYGSSSQQTEQTDESGSSMKGLKAGKTLTVSGGTFTINSADDGVHANGNLTVNGGAFTVTTGDDGFHADDTLTVTDGNITVTESYEGLEGLHIALSGGLIQLTASDDGLNAAGGIDQSGFGGPRGNDPFGGGQMSAGNGSITLSGGQIRINASGDGIDANGTLEMTGGYVTVCGPTTGDTAVLDYDSSATISGGTFIGTGAYQMAQTFGESSQGVISVSVGNQAVGTPLKVMKEDEVLISFEPTFDYAIAIVSSPDLEKGKSYTLCVGELSEAFEAN